jgi:N-acetylmuramoyl-L-alanine amidase
MLRLRRFAAASLVCWVLIVCWSWLAVAADELQIWVGNKRHKVDSRERDRVPYYEIGDIAAGLGLEFVEQDGQARLSGPRGHLELTDGRGLVRFGTDYILVSHPLWRRREKNWYAPEDFLLKTLPLVLDQKLVKEGPLRYRVTSLGENRVQVEVTNLPDHVKITFLPAKKTPVRILELKDRLEVRFEGQLVTPALPKERPDARIVASLEFDSSDVYGVFRIVKGEQYYNFREYALEQPDRRVLDLYSPPASARVPSVEEVVSEPPVETQSIPSPARTQAGEQIPVFQPRQYGSVVVVDPGHGGEEYGVHPSQEVLEKNLNLALALRIEERLRASAHRGLLTRRQDVEVPLQQRSAAANANRSKAFVSIHVGGAPAISTKGPVVYAHRYFEANTAANSAGQYASTPAARKLVLWEDAQRSHLSESRELAALVQAALNPLFGANNEVVEAPLAALESVACPAVLVEAGFATNPEDLEKLTSQAFLDQVASAVAQAVTEFLSR